MDLKARLDEVMRATGWTRADLVRVTGVSSSAVSQWFGHGTKPINKIGDIVAAVNIERASGYSAAWVAVGKGPRYAPGAGAPALASEPAARYVTQTSVPVAAALHTLHAALAHTTPQQRDAAARLLEAWATDPTIRRPSKPRCSPCCSRPQRKLVSRLDTMT